jgi:hypothetical protein
MEAPLFHYSLNFAKETEASEVSLPFCFEVAIGDSLENVQREWLDSFTSAGGRWLWPRDLSIPTLEGPEIAVGCYFNLAYQMPDPGNLGAPPKQYVYHYSVTQWERAGSRMVFRYQAEHGGYRKHPFRGGGTVTIEPAGERQCRLRWKGAYLHNGNRQGAEDVFAHYFSLFFTTMAKNVRVNAPPGGAISPNATAPGI